MTNSVTYFTYLVRCSDGTYYAGSTPDIKKRLRQHNGEISGGAHYTKIRRPVMLSYIEEHETYALARTHEAALKKLTRKQKEALIKSS